MYNTLGPRLARTLLAQTRSYIVTNLLPSPFKHAKILVLTRLQSKTRKNAIVEYLDYQIPVTQLMGPKGNGDMQAAKGD